LSQNQIYAATETPLINSTVVIAWLDAFVPPAGQALQSQHYRVSTQQAFTGEHLLQIIPMGPNLQISRPHLMQEALS